MFKNVRIEHISNGDHYNVFDRSTGRKVGEIHRIKGQYEVWMRGHRIGTSAVLPTAMKIADNHLHK